MCEKRVKKSRICEGKVDGWMDRRQARQGLVHVVDRGFYDFYGLLCPRYRKESSDQRVFTEETDQKQAKRNASPGLIGPSDRTKLMGFEVGDPNQRRQPSSPRDKVRQKETQKEMWRGGKPIDLLADVLTDELTRDAREKTVQSSQERRGRKITKGE